MSGRSPAHVELAGRSRCRLGVDRRDVPLAQDGDRRQERDDAEADRDPEAEAEAGRERFGLRVAALQQIGGALGLALLTTVATTRTTDLLEGGTAQPEALTSGFSLAFWVAAGFGVVSLLTTIAVLRQRDIPAVDAEPAPAPAG